jgi:hypothetical protein
MQHRNNRSTFYYEGFAAFQRGITNNPHTNGDCDSAGDEWEQGYDAAEQEAFDNEYVTNIRSRNAQQIYE